MLFAVGCGPTTHVVALREYESGRPAVAEETLFPLLQKTHKNDILYLWDMGMFRFAQGNYMMANEAWLKSDELAGIEPGALDTGLELFTTDADKRFIGDPVEYSMAFLYVGLGYYVMGDYENATVAFRKSLEWDYSGNPERQGDMVITNMMLAECYSRTGDHDQAVVGYRRALQSAPELIPAYIGIYRELDKMGDNIQEKTYREELAALISQEYAKATDRNPQGVLVVVMSGPAPKIEAQGEVFRKRKELASSIDRWQIECSGHRSAVATSLADELITHLKDQGGELGQAVRKVTQATVAEAMQEVPILGLFAPSTEADLRYWTTLPGRIYAGYIPLEPGLHSIRATAYDENGVSLENYRQTWHYIPVHEGENTVLVIISHKNLQELM
ncbi:MAG: hypothetical protein GTO29_13415 [Candidatus Latescibacteria bacterium]|nr:hypothetical protein [Candidatus Latescibacterota bacterium]NIO57250.1 hypothetical protein [Candidatus Latescibacterota bacterium]